MIKKTLFFFCLFAVLCSNAQKKSSDFRSKKIVVTKDTLQIDSVSINPKNFKVIIANGETLPPKNYDINFSKAQLIVNSKKYNVLTVEYYRYPNFITKTYTPYNKNIIAPNTNNTKQLYSFTSNKKSGEKKLFEGLKTQGFIARRVTAGNNQNAVTNASLDLTISGKLSDNVSIRGNIFDTNIPLQQNGYSQNITDFNRVFLELYTKNWRVKAGDISLTNNESYFLKFDKQITGLLASANINKKTNVAASGAIVRGRFTANDFIGLEGNQGPYKLHGPNNEPAIVIVAESDKVFVNGMLLKRGETKDYVIDYNLGEIRFNTTYPITNDMRIRVEFQYANQNYTRFITYEKAHYASDNFSISGYFYNENDAKNQPLQQSLTTQQKQILANAGNDASKMVSPSAYLDTYNPNRIQYKKSTVNGVTIFEYSTDENDELYSVTFTNVGTNQGDYVIDKSTTIGTIFKYAGNHTGNYSPIVRLAAPSSLQIMDVKTHYQPSKKTIVNAELAHSNNDLNLFSAIDNNKNKRIATKINWQQTLLDAHWKLKSTVDYKFIQNNFTAVQRFQNVEFNRDWNLTNPTGNQNQVATGLTLKNEKNDWIMYRYNHLNFNDNNGNKHQLTSKLNFKNTYFSLNSSLLNNSSNSEKDAFFRLQSKAEHSFGKSWIGALINFETNKKKDKVTDLYLISSHKFKDYKTYFGIGDSSKVFAKIGVNYRINDSIKSNSFTQINNRKTIYASSKLIQNKTTNLSLFANYRLTNNSFTENEKSLNSKVLYNQQFFSNFLIINTLYETSSGNLAQQDYVYVETEPGHGYYTWIDYNNDGEKQFNEFEVAQFQDQADYLRVALPNLHYLPTQEAKLKQAVTLNPSQWQTKSGFKKFISHFYNQTYLLTENVQQRLKNSFLFNPFNFDKNNALELIFNFRNSLYFNRNLKNYSLVYTYGKTRAKQQYSIGSQENNSFIHQLELTHKLSKFWVFDLKTIYSTNNLNTENFTNRNYKITSNEINPKLTFLYNENQWFSIFYHFKNKKNKLQNFESLQQQKVGLSYFFISKKQNQINANFNMFLNNFSGNANSPIGYQLLEGLQAGNNYTWDILFTQKLNSFLNLNLSYMGRKSENSKIIHTGSIQIKAIF
ncbi:hypothetical protein [Tenacibaculum sp. UWU-22]|uniref:hypothetical protein n=1 Tax=Tenacibaculum sp. UWU-22 TaxID=3234187 RepID=UPI0034DB7BB3